MRSAMDRQDAGFTSQSHVASPPEERSVVPLGLNVKWKN